MGHIIPGGTGFDYHKQAKKFVDKAREEPLIFDFSDDSEDVLKTV